MKIAFFVNSFPNLSETFVLNQMTGLLDRGHEVDIYASEYGNNREIHADVEKYNLLDRTFYFGEDFRKSMSVNGFLLLIKAVGLFISNFHKQPIPLLESLNVLKFRKSAVSLASYYATIIFLDKGLDRYDIVHCHFGPSGRWGAVLKDIGLIKGKVITAFYGYDVSRYVKTHGHNAYKHLFETGDLFLPLSDRMKTQLVALGCKKQKIVVHRLGIDTRKHLFHPRWLREDGKVNLLTISRLVEKKGVQYSIRAVAKLVKDYPQIEYKIVGDGPLRDELQGLINTLNLDDYVKLLGWKRQEEVVTLLREADIFLAPSVTSKDGDEEGTPVALMEALAGGLPVLSTHHSAIPEIVQDGQSGFLVPERDIDALAKKLEYLIEHPETWAKMGQIGRQHVEQYYDINKLNDQLVELYRQLLKRDLT